MNKNNLCEGQNCRYSEGEVRLLPITLGGSTQILCQSCFDFEMVWRRDRNIDLPNDCRMAVPKWEELKPYNPNAGIVAAYPGGRYTNTTHNPR